MEAIPLCSCGIFFQSSIFWSVMKVSFYLWRLPKLRCNIIYDVWNRRWRNFACFAVALDFSGRSLFLNVLRESFSEERTTVYEISLSSLQPSNGIPDSSTQYRIHFIGGTKLINEWVIHVMTNYARNDVISLSCKQSRGLAATLRTSISVAVD